MSYKKYNNEKYLQKVLDFIDKNFDPSFIEVIDGEKGILHGHYFMDTNSGEPVTVGYDYVFDQIMYIRECQPLMFDNITNRRGFKNK